MSEKTSSGRSAAGLFDVRNIIAALLGIYGIVLTVMGIVHHSGQQIAKSDGLNLNLWTGIGLIIVSIIMAVWAWTRPIIVVPEEIEHHDGPDSAVMDTPGDR
ncbi:hypothetical protein [Leekyejoonella antrihumi]|uniref:Uncharacterized protein n=1 Tax=Leekyejoonella antrihumi TaxID=1660198 RepID=A0A563E095_9MICO|nr:hypothetical protein [Leekyejoonella antrihumi]TWP35304.1 hypothetical protein FGL98_14395 [Leekyejoonella antrihumi]